MGAMEAALIIDQALKNPAVVQELSSDHDAAKKRWQPQFPGLPDGELAQLIKDASLSYAVVMQLQMQANEQERDQIRNMSEGFRQGLVDVVREVDRGYKRVMLMYTVAFYFGIALVASAAIASLVFERHITAGIFGGLGMVDLVTALVFRPAQELQNSRAGLAQLQGAFFAWANDTRNWTAYLERLDASIAYGTAPQFDDFARVSHIMLSNTEQMLRLVEEFVEVQTAPPLNKKRSTTARAPLPEGE